MQPGIKQLSDFGTTPDGQTVQRWQLDNGRGLIMEVLNLGGIVTRLSVPDRHGQSGQHLSGPSGRSNDFSPGMALFRCVDRTGRQSRCKCSIHPQRADLPVGGQ
ncbi:MAG: hypothetical protein KatS3mg104_2727 [Phycisphaerae bacterium]|nr:MAG: hypothetical protein KatS3mg104_2727 [Phycisphaerae bacterium]